MEANLKGAPDPTKHLATSSLSTTHGLVEENVNNLSSNSGNQKEVSNNAGISSGSIAKGSGNSGGNKNSVEKKLAFTFEDRIKAEGDIEFSELLGSVTTLSCPGTRTSARVIQKLKQDLIRPTTPPPSERDPPNKRGGEDDHGPSNKRSSGPKTPSHLRANKPTWSNVERNHFFDAINDLGKDFEAISNYINLKLKRKSPTDVAFKTKDQVRQHYYQTCHKIYKYIKFTDEIKKPVQELYALINYGEMRRKLQLVTEKHFVKLKQLVYDGKVVVRCKGKNIRIKTPSCKALRRLNKLHDTLEDIRLPSKVEITLQPANMDAFSRVQALAQNPRIRTTAHLQKKLASFIRAFQYKWRSQECRLAEEESKLNQNSNGSDHTMPTAINSYQDPHMCFLPKPGVPIHRPLVCITEYLSNAKISLSAYEERMGIQAINEDLPNEKPGNKRSRTESGSEKRSPDSKKIKSTATTSTTASATTNLTISPHEKPVGAAITHSGGAEGSDRVNVKEEVPASEISCDELRGVIVQNSFTDPGLLPKIETATMDTTIKTEPSPVPKNTEVSTSSTAATGSITQASPVPHNTPRQRRNTAKSAAALKAKQDYRPLLNDEMMKRIRQGWTLLNAGDLTLGDLYVVFGQDSKLELEYYWTNCKSQQSTPSGAAATESTSSRGPLATSQTSDSSPNIFNQKLPYNPHDCDDQHLVKTLTNAPLGNRLKHLLLIANLSERIRKKPCFCGHSCERNLKLGKDLVSKTFVSSKTFPSTVGGNNVFRQPIMPFRRPIANMDPVAQLAALTRQGITRQILVQRYILPNGGGGNAVGVNQTTQTNNYKDNIREKKIKADVSSRTKATQKVSVTTSSRCKEEVANTPPAVSPVAPNPTCSEVKTEEDEKPLSDTSNHCEKEVASTPPAVSPVASNPTSNEAKIEEEEKPVSTANHHMPTLDDNSLELPPLALTGSSSTDTNNGPTFDSHSSLNTPTPTSRNSMCFDSTFDDCSNGSIFACMSPMHLIRESTSNSRWLEENLNDYSLTSLLGHLDEINTTRSDLLDPTSSNLSIISESSVDYRHKFQEITALMQNQDKD